MEENSFKKMMLLFPEDDTLYLEALDEDADMVAGSPLNTLTHNVKIGMTMISSFEEAIASGYPIATDGSSKRLDERLEEETSKRIKTQ
jgi:hypothetical protein